MAIRTVVTRGYGNGTFDGTIALIATRGYLPGEEGAAGWWPIELEKKKRIPIRRIYAKAGYKIGEPITAELDRIIGEMVPEPAEQPIIVRPKTIRPAKREPMLPADVLLPLGKREEPEIGLAPNAELTEYLRRVAALARWEALLEAAQERDDEMALISILLAMD